MGYADDDIFLINIFLDGRDAWYSSSSPYSSEDCFRVMTILMVLMIWSDVNKSLLMFKSFLLIVIYWLRIGGGGGETDRWRIFG